MSKEKNKDAQVLFNTTYQACALIHSDIHTEQKALRRRKKERKKQRERINTERQISFLLDLSSDYLVSGSNSLAANVAVRSGLGVNAEFVNDARPVGGM